jgi:hypothetical protein
MDLFFGKRILISSLKDLKNVLYVTISFIPMVSYLKWLVGHVNISSMGLVFKNGSSQVTKVNVLCVNHNFYEKITCTKKEFNGFN